MAKADISRSYWPEVIDRGKQRTAAASLYLRLLAGVGVAAGRSWRTGTNDERGRYLKGMPGGSARDAKPFREFWRVTCRTTINTAKRAMSDRPDEDTNDPLIADHRNFYKVEKWSRDGLRVELMLYAGSSLDKARRIFEQATKHRPRIRLTIRQRMRVLDEWPRHETLL
jgi:hypothetical protein